MSLDNFRNFERLGPLSDELASVSRDARSIHNPRRVIVARTKRRTIEDMAAFLLALRDHRNSIFAPMIEFDDCAWHIILQLIVAESEGAPMSIAALCAATSVPQTTAIRKLNNLAKSGFVIRRPDLRDHRRIMITLTDRSRQSLILLCERATGRGHQSANVAIAE